MKQIAIAAVGSGALAIALAFGVGVAVGQQNPPTENKGLTVSAPTTLDLGQEIDSTEGRQLRLRLVTLEPGGVVGIHSHKGRPGVAYVLQGTLTESREGGTVKQRQPGESWSEGKDTTHWAENKGDKPVVLVAVDVFKP
jgi:quercetin dioxygenase-like cupin family protein